MTRRGKIRLAALLCGLVAVLGGLWADSHFMLASSATQLEYAQRRSLNDLTDYVSGLRSTLRKAPYVNTASMRNTLSMELAEQSGGAKAALSALPLSQEASDRLSRFLSQTGDYALYLARRSAAGEDPDENSGDVLATLEEYAGKLSQALEKAQAKADTENLSLSGVRSALNNIEDFSSLPSLDDDFDQAAKEFAQFPTLLYDGPFSDHIPQRAPLFLAGEREVTQEEAAQEAARFLGVDPSRLNALGEGGSQIAVWAFATEDSQVSITKAGGQVAYYKKAGAVNAENLSAEQAVEKARQALADLGIRDVRESYYVKNDNTCTVNFAGLAALDGQEVLCYPDLVKVTIELEQGGTVEIDTAGWMMNRHQRDLAAPSLSQEQAVESVSPRLTVSESALAVIPTPGLDEVLCWEFHCFDGDREFLVYINAENGQEEQLYLLRRDDHGTLVI